MKIRAKILLILGTILIVFIPLLLIATRFIVFESYLDLEEDEAIEHVLWTDKVIVNDLDLLSHSAADWAYWDDTYDFVDDLNEAYIEDNLANETLANLNINMMVFVNMAGDVVYGKYIDIETGEDASPPNLDAIINPNSPALNLPDESSDATGFISTSDTVLEFASRSILTNDSQGPRHGTLIFGRYVEQEHIAQLLPLPLTLHLINTQSPTLDEQTIQRVIASPTPVIKRINKNELAAYHVVDDVYGEPVMILQVDVERDIYSQGVKDAVYLFTAIGILGIVIVAAVYFALDKIVVSRTIQVQTFISDVRETGNLSQQLPITGKDELSELSDHLNQMVDSLAKSRNQLEQSHNELERRVEQRTHELAESNQQLLLEVAERIQAQSDSAEARDQALSALRVKTQILANVSHDVRTPLTIIMTGAELLKRGELTEKQAKRIEGIEINSRQLLGFFNNLLDEAQSEADKIELEIKPFKTQTLLENIDALATTLAIRKGLVYQSNLSPEMPETLNGDVERITRIIFNLADNAIKFTDEGGITVNIYPKSDIHWSIAVIDSGIGMSPDHQEQIFEAFWQVDGSTTRKANRGVGLGLSIVKQLTTLMGGEITVESEIGKGSTFTVTLPFVQEYKEYRDDLIGAYH
jgi:signal transduction histidine kinase